MKIKQHKDGMTIVWDNDKTVELNNVHKDSPDFWRIIEVLLRDAHVEGSIVAIKQATIEAEKQIEAKKNSKPRIIC